MESKQGRISAAHKARSRAAASSTSAAVRQNEYRMTVSSACAVGEPAAHSAGAGSP